MLTTGFVLTGQGVHQDVDSARIRHQPGGGQPGEVSSGSGVPFLTKAVTFSNLKFKFLEVQNCLDFQQITIDICRNVPLSNYLLWPVSAADK